MLRFLPYLLKNLWRHRLRTLLTLSGAAVAIFVFVFVGSVQEGLNELTQNQLSDQRLIVFQANRFCPSTSKLPEDYARQVRAVPGVKDAVPVKVFMNNCRASLDVVVFHGMPADKLRVARDLTLISGDWNEFEKRRDGAVVGQAIAARRGLKLGQRFSIGAATVTIVGICRSAVATDENFIFTHLEFLQRIPGLNSVGTATQIEVLVSSEADVQQVANAIDEKFRSGNVGTNTRPLGVFQLDAVGDLVELIGFLRYLAYACVGLVLALVGTTTLMAVQDRVREFAVLQTIGFSGPLLFLLVLAESIVLSTVGGAIGVGLATLLLKVGNLAIGTEGVLVPFLATPLLILIGLAVSLLAGFLAGIPSAWSAARAEIVSGLRA
ncbi:MAG: ABC transporter permease [Pirellulaceae bacterium]|nr:ABC transporter permease [Pirellulaceae bacterium]